MAEADPYVSNPLGTVLVTGGCGFLGSHIVSLLLAQTSPSSTNVHVLDLRPPRITQANTTYHSADITSVDSLRSILEKIKPDVVIHTVSPVFQSGGGKKARDFTWKVNVDGTRVLMEEAKRIGTRAFVYTSSASVVSDTYTDLINADERWPLVTGKAQPEYYSETKAEAEALALAASTRKLGPMGTPFLTTSIRPSAMFGELDVQMIPRMLDVLRTGRTNFQLGENDNLFDYTYVGNTAHAHLLAAAKLLELSRRLESAGSDAVQSSEKDGETDDENRVDGEAFIITNLTPIYFWDFSRALWNAYYTVRPTAKPPATSKQVYTLPRGLALFIASIATFILSLFGKKPSLQPVTVRYACMTRYFKTRKAEACLGYVPAFTLEEGIARTVKWFAEREDEEAARSETKKER